MDRRASLNAVDMVEDDDEQPASGPGAQDARYLNLI